MKKSLIVGMISAMLFTTTIPIVQNNNQILAVSKSKKKSETMKIKYNTAKKIEKALNSGENLEGKTVRFKVTKLISNSAFGYNMETGKHLNFVSPNHPGIKKGQKVTLKITKITSVFGSYVIYYKNLRK